MDDNATRGPILAVTFDLWDTLIVDDSDEPKRAARGLPPKPAQRRELVYEFLHRHGPLQQQAVEAAYDTVDAAFRHVWYEQDVTWTVAERLGVLLQGLGRELPAAEFAELVRLHEEMELDPRPDFVAGAVEAVRALRGRYKLGVISDAIFSPGRILRQMLADAGLADAFDTFTFSDEVGASKPHPKAFLSSAEALGVDIAATVHVGDREQKDVAGPHALGARAVLFTGARDRSSQGSEADAVCDDLRQLPDILDSLTDI